MSDRMTDPATTRAAGSKGNPGQSPPPREFDDARLDAVAAAPGFHTPLLENDAVRVLDTRIEPGQIVPLHTHRWPAAYYILSVGDFVRRDEHGRVTLDTRATPTGLRPGTAVWSPALGPHTLENVGATTIHVVSIEVKDTPATSISLQR
ncbi:MAG: cupin domain-containing protein [Phycisphaerales bacterium]